MADEIDKDKLDNFQDAIEESESEDETNPVVIPVAKQSAITRKRNDIMKYLKAPHPGNIAKVKTILAKYTDNMTKLKEAYNEQHVRKDISVYERAELQKWFWNNNTINQEFEKQVNSWLFKAEFGKGDETYSDLVNGVNTVTSDVNMFKGIIGATSTGDGTEQHEEKSTIDSNNDSSIKSSKKDDSEKMQQSDNPSGTSVDYLAKVMLKQTELTQMIAESQARSMLPAPEPDYFDGSDITEYQSFILSFDRTIAARTKDYADLYYNLKKYTKGEAHKRVKSNNTNLKEAYKRARANLESKYGNKNMLAEEYIRKLRKWPAIAREEVKPLKELSIFLEECQSMMGNMSTFSQLNGSSQISNIIKKLPMDYQRKFGEKAANMIEEGREVLFSDVVKFVEGKVRVLETPIYGELGRESFVKKKVLTTKTDQQQKPQCPCCKRRNHRLDNCFFFLKKSLESRKEFINERKLCLSCLEPNHPTKNCKNKITCKHCKNQHPSSLHIKKDETQATGSPILSTNPPSSSNSVEQHAAPQQEKKEDTKSDQASSNANQKAGLSCQTRANLSSSTIKNPAILVDVKFRGSNKSVRTYLGLDTFCDSMYVDPELVSKAGINPKPVSFAITTLQATNEPNVFGHVEGIEISSVDRSCRTTIKEGFVPKNWPFTIEDSPKASDIENFDKLKTLPIPFDDVKIGILIGPQRADILRPLQTISTSKRGPYCTRHSLGWSISGPITGEHHQKSKCLRTKANFEEFHQIKEEFQSVFARDFAEVDEEPMHSVEDRRWLESAENSIVQLPNNHLQIRLPFEQSDVRMPNNFNQAYSRIMKQKAKFEKDPELFKEYSAFMKDMLENDYAEAIPIDEIDSCPEGKRWYLVHFSVKHKTKQKIRVVYHCSLKYEGVSLNDVLLQGPDNTNSLVGVLLRFREGPIAFSADVRSMFYQVRVTERDSDFLRFLWFESNDLSKPIAHYRLKVHVFGATSSMSNATYALRQTATLGKDRYPEQVLLFINRNFYVDDALKGCEDTQSAIELAKNVIKLLEEYGFELTSFISNSREFLKSLPPEKLSKNLKELELSEVSLPVEKTLGMVWLPDLDCFGCRLSTNNFPHTMRGMLQKLYSIYDPLFFSSPVIIPGKRIFQEACSLKLNYDDELPTNLAKRWKQWTSELPLLRDFKVPRCFMSEKYEKAELHIFSDGSFTAFGCCGYLRFIREDKTAHTSIVAATARMTPIGRSSLKSIALKTPPRVELNAAKLGVLLRLRILKEIELKVSKIYHWTDSLTCLRYIRSEQGRFRVFVANRIDFIRSNSRPDEWFHVLSPSNPADILSRGSSIQNFLENKQWLFGPSFLQNPKEPWPKQEFSTEIPADDEEVVRKSFYISQEPNPTDRFLQYTNEWSKIKSNVAIFIKFVQFLKNRGQSISKINVSDMRNSELYMWRYIQQREFPDIIDRLKKEKPLSKHQLVKMSPFLDSQGILRVGGRLKNSTLSENSKNPIILPKKCPTVHALFRHVHSRTGHQGRENILAQIRKKYYVIAMSSLAYKITQECIICRRLLSQPSTQVMANLPSDRLQSDLPPFTNSGIDCWGPMLVTRGRGRAQEKRYGLIISCVASRACHLELLHSLDTDSFVNALRRFYARRGPGIKRIRCDNGTNFVSGKKEIAHEIKAWNQRQIEEWCKIQEIEWIFNPPAAPHWGSMWEREIKTCKKVLQSMMFELENKRTLCDESLATFLTEVENVMNSRPITQVTCDVNDKEALTPNHLLKPATENSFPPGIFKQDDLYSKRRWRQVQYLVNEFWIRWRKEYLPLLMSRQKWTSEKRSFEVDDLVLVVDQLLPRNQWCLGRIDRTHQGQDGRVRSAEVVVAKHCDANGNLAGTHRLTRPISKLILLKTQDQLKNETKI